MFGGAGSGLATNAAQRVAKARKNYASTGRRAALLKEAELESHSLGGAFADPTFKSAGHATQASLRAGAAAAATKKENNERAKVSKNITARAIASVKKAANNAAANNMRIIADPWSRYIVKELWPLTAGKNKGQGWKPYKSNANINQKVSELAPQIKNLGRTRIHKNLNIALNTGHIGKKAVLGWANQNVANRKKHFYHILDVAIGGAERNKFKKLINSGANISHTNRQRIDLVYNNLSKELKARNEAAKTANTVAIRKELASILELNNVEKIKPRVTKLNRTFKHWRKQVNSGNFEKLKLLSLIHI
jgi:hypothetical protein